MRITWRGCSPIPETVAYIPAFGNRSEAEIVAIRKKIIMSSKRLKIILNKGLLIKQRSRWQKVRTSRPYFLPSTGSPSGRPHHTPREEYGNHAGARACRINMKMLIKINMTRKLEWYSLRSDWLRRQTLHLLRELSESISLMLTDSTLSRSSMSWYLRYEHWIERLRGCELTIMRSFINIEHLRSQHQTSWERLQKVWVSTTRWCIEFFNFLELDVILFLLLLYYSLLNRIPRPWIHN
jgi:hypothetical protein